MPPFNQQSYRITDKLSANVNIILCWVGSVEWMFFVSLAICELRWSASLVRQQTFNDSIEANVFGYRVS